jgi:hypothetical protein
MSKIVFMWERQKVYVGENVSHSSRMRSSSG